ncbi:MAG: LLM class F420-dependent oxidoreductase, partial [Rubrobacter sp.]|nr:LLM class F420-dependent oxidoreductase [Rubrobacter sp.]
YADEWNAVLLTPEAFAERNARLDELLQEAGRPLESVCRTLMTRAIYGRTEADVDRKLEGESREDLDPGIIAGTADEFVGRLGKLSEAGVERVMLQWLETDDLDGLEALASEVLPQL